LNPSVPNKIVDNIVEFKKNDDPHNFTLKSYNFIYYMWNLNHNNIICKIT